MPRTLAVAVLVLLPPLLDAPRAAAGLSASPAWTTVGGQAAASHGMAVAPAGDVNGDGFSDVLVAAPTYDGVHPDGGRVQLYLGAPSGLATTPAWTGDGDQDSSLFGSAVAPAGDVNGDGFADVVIGASQYAAPEYREGRAYVYLGSASGLAATPVWVAEGNQVGAAFGAAVAAAGDVNGDGYADVLVGAPSFTSGQAGEGRAFLYLGSPSGPAGTPAWTAESDLAGASFGSAVAGAGDVDADGYADVVVGAPAVTNGQTSEGRVYFYPGSASGPSATATWTAESNSANARLGVAVAGAGDTNGDGYADLLVGASGFTNGQTGEGRASVYLGGATGPAPVAVWTTESNQVGAGLGTTVATAGDVNGDGYADLAIGSPLADAPETDEGRVGVTLGSSTGPLAAPAWTGESNQAGGAFGGAVATAGDVNGDGFSDIVVGAPSYDSTGVDAGRAYVFHGAGDTLALAPDWSLEGNQPGANFGFRSASAGDVNADGYGDVVITAYLWDGAGGTVDEGAAWLYLGSRSGPVTPATWFAEPAQAGANYGTAAGSAGDVNGDGYGDVIVGCRLCDGDLVDEGRAYVYLGGPAGPSTTPAWTVEGDQAGAELGLSAAAAGDVNGDGYSDVLVGARHMSAPKVQGGRALLYLGGPTGLATTPAWFADGDQDSAEFGFKVASAGDVNGDGYSDAVVGAWLRDAGSLRNAGTAYVYLGGPAGLDTSPSWVTSGDQAGAQYGIQDATAGDVNGDGYSDLLVGANNYPLPATLSGRAYLYLGSAAGLASTPQWTFGAKANSFLGTVNSAGDVNGDGLSDVVISAPMYDDPETDEGAAWLFLGTPAGLAATPAWAYELNQSLARLGEAAASAGDVNGDGFADVIFGADGYHAPEPSEGGSFLWYGNKRRGLDRIPRQARSDGSALAPLGLCDAPSVVRLRALGRTAAGRARVRLVWDVEPLGVGFSGAAAGPFSDTGTPGAAGSGVALEALATGLSAGAPYHWRLRVETASPFFPHTPWLGLPLNAPRETDFRTSTVTAVQPGAQRGVIAFSAQPHPCRDAALVSYTLPTDADVTLTVFAADGRRVALLARGHETAGGHSVRWSARGADSRRVAAGIYVVELRAGGAHAARKLVVLP